MLETVMYVETRDNYTIDELKGRIEKAFYCHFRENKFKFSRTVEIPAPFQHPAGEGEFTYRDGDPGADFLLEGKE